jgi:hypothetical protein
VSTTFPPQKPGRHGWADLLTLVDAIREVAYSPSLAADDQMRRIRDLFLDYDQPDAADDA